MSSRRKRKASSGENGDEVLSKNRKLADCDPAPFYAESFIPDPDYIRMTKEEAQSGKYDRPVRVYADGIYDVFHSGHARQLMQAKLLFPNVHLLVGVCSDKMTHSLKGRTVFNEAERYDSLRHCRYVDEVIRNAPWSLSDEFLDKYQIDFVAHDDLPYTIGSGEDGGDVYAPLKERGMFMATERTPGISTSDIITRIVKDYDLYVRRNLNRGYNRHELNVGPLHASRIKAQENLSNITDGIKETITGVRDSFGDLIHDIEIQGRDMLEVWKEKSTHFVRSFLELYAPINQIGNRIRNAISPPASPEREGSSSDTADNDINADGGLDNPMSPSFAMKEAMKDKVFRSEVESTSDNAAE